MTETKLSLGRHVGILDDSKLPLSFSLVLAHDRTSRHLFRGDRGSGGGGVNCRKTEAASVWTLKFFGAELRNISSLEEEQRPEGSLLAPGVVALLSAPGLNSEKGARSRSAAALIARPSALTHQERRRACGTICHTAAASRRSAVRPLENPARAAGASDCPAGIY